MKYVLIIPARNEAGNIDRTVAALRQRLSQAASDYEIVTSTSRLLNANVRTYQVDAGATSTVVEPTLGATSASGDYTFVKVKVNRVGGAQSGASPTKCPRSAAVSLWRTRETPCSMIGPASSSSVT